MSAHAYFGPTQHTSCQLYGSLSHCVPLLVPSQPEEWGLLEWLGLARGLPFSLPCAPVTFEDTGLGLFSGRELRVARAADTYPRPLSISMSISRAVCFSVLLRALPKFQAQVFKMRAGAFLIDADGMKAYALPAKSNAKAWRSGALPLEDLRLLVHHCSQLPQDPTRLGQ